MKFRPSYPEPVFDALATRLAPELPRVAADIGSGTGIFSRGLLAREHAQSGCVQFDYVTRLHVGHLP